MVRSIVHSLLSWLWLIVVVTSGCGETQPAPGTLARDRVQRLETPNRPGDLLLDGRWLVWSFADPLVTPSVSTDVMIGVYDLVSRQRVFTDLAGQPLWLSGDQLYIARYSPRSYLGRPAWPRYDIYRFDLSLGSEELILEGIDSLKVNSRVVVYTRWVPEVCQTTADCAFYYSRCSKQLMTLDLNTGEKKELGVNFPNMTVVDVSTNLAILSSQMGRCDIKAYPGPLHAVDLETGEYWLLNSIYPLADGRGRYLDTLGRTIVYAPDRDQAVVLEVEPYGVARVLFAATGVQAKGLAGSDILLYAQLSEEEQNFGYAEGLAAVNVRNHQTQTIAAEGIVRSAVGDAFHVAWVTYSDELFVAPLALTPRLFSQSSGMPMNTPNATYMFPQRTPARLPATVVIEQAYP